MMEKRNNRIEIILKFIMKELLLGGILCGVYDSTHSKSFKNATTSI